MFGFKMPGLGFKPSHIFKMLGSMGIDPAGLAEKYLPQLVTKARELEQQVGSRLMGTLSLADDGSHFILCLYKFSETGAAELWKSYPLSDIKKILEDLKTAIPDDDATSTPTAEQVADDHTIYITGPDADRYADALQRYNEQHATGGPGGPDGGQASTAGGSGAAV